MLKKNHTIISQLSKKFKSIIQVQIFITIILFLSSNKNSYAQIKNNDEFVLIEKLFKNNYVTKIQKNKYKNLKDHSNIITYYLFILYKNFISSQDASHCVFIPSCSEYALNVISKQGIFPGIFNAIDRFSRCHSLSIENYEYNEDLQLLIDPPTNWKYEKIE